MTRASSDHPALRGRAYPVRFGAVWSAALRVLESLRGWTVLGTDGRSGEIRATVAGRVWKRPDEVSIMVSLDEHGLTRLDVAATPLTRRIGRRVTIRRVARLLRAVDAAL